MQIVTMAYENGLLDQEPAHPVYLERATWERETESQPPSARVMGAWAGKTPDEIARDKQNVKAAG